MPTAKAPALMDVDPMRFYKIRHCHLKFSQEMKCLTRDSRFLLIGSPHLQRLTAQKHFSARFIVLSSFRISYRKQILSQSLIQLIFSSQWAKNTLLKSPVQIGSVNLTGLWSKSRRPAHLNHPHSYERQVCQVLRFASFGAHLKTMGANS